MSGILKGIVLNEVDPHDYDSDWDYQDAVKSSGRRQPSKSTGIKAYVAALKKAEAEKAAAEKAAKDKEQDLSEEKLDEISNEKLAQYKTAASADATKADSEGDFKRGDKRFSGIVRATKKQFKNDIDQHYDDIQKKSAISQGINEFVVTGGPKGPKDYGQPNSSRYIGGNKFVVGTTNNYVLTATIDKWGLEWDEDDEIWFLDSPGAAHIADASEGEIELPPPREQRNQIHDLVTDYLNERNSADLQKVAAYYGHSDDGEMATNEDVAEGSLNELSSDLLRRAEVNARQKSNSAQNQWDTPALKPVEKYYDTLSNKFAGRAEKVGQQDAVKKIASTAAMRKMGIAEGDNLKSNAMAALTAAKQHIQQQRRAELEQWEKDFFANNVRQPNLRQHATSSAAVSQPGERHSVLQYRLIQLNKAIDKQGILDKLIDRIDRKGLLTSALKNDVDTSLLVRDGPADNYKSLNQKLDKALEFVKNRLLTNKAAFAKSKKLEEEEYQRLSMASYLRQADALHEKMMSYSKMNDKPNYERVLKQYLALEKVAKQGLVAEGSLNEFAPPSSNRGDGGGENERSRRLRKLLEIAIQVAKEKNVDELGMIHAMNMIAGDDFFNVAVEGILPDITDKEYMFVLQSAYKTVKQGLAEGDVVPFKQPAKALTWKQVPKDILLLANDWFWASEDNSGLDATIDPDGFGNGTANDVKYNAAKLQQKGWTIDYNYEYDGPGEFNLRLTNNRGQTVLLSIEDAQTFKGWAKGTSQYDLEEGVDTQHGLTVKDQDVTEEKQRLDPKCWKGYKKQGTKMKGGTRVNNCVPVKETNSSILEGIQQVDEINWKHAAAASAMALGALGSGGAHAGGVSLDSNKGFQPQDQITMNQQSQQTANDNSKSAASGLSTEYLQQAAKNVSGRIRMMVSSADAIKELQARENGAQQTVAPTASPSTATIPGQGLVRAERADRQAGTVTVDGQEYKMIMLEPGGIRPRGGQQIVIPQAVMGERGIGNYMAILAGGRVFVLPRNE